MEEQIQKAVDCTMRPSATVLHLHVREATGSGSSKRLSMFNELDRRRAQGGAG